MTCKDCIFEPQCILRISYSMGDDDITGKASTNMEELCRSFKNKADFVEVVRCPECIYCENMKCTELKDNTGHFLDVAIFDYCSQGVRK